MIIVFARGSETISAALAALDAGADDHVSKADGLEQLHRRLRLAFARRPARRILACGPIELDCDTAQVTVGGKPVELTKQQWLLLFRMMQCCGQPVAAEQLYGFAGIQRDPSHINLQNAICRLRARIGPFGAAVIQAVAGVGYQASPTPSANDSR